MGTTVIHEGEYADALARFLEIGGQFYPARHPQGSNTIVCGNRTEIFWKKDSPLRIQLLQAARMFGYDSEDITASKLCRKILSEVVKLDTEKTYFSKHFQSMARDGGHWHYTHIETGYHPFLIEFDLKSAYFTSLFHGKSLLYHERGGFQDDGGALENLRQLNPLIPKWLRLTLLGVIAAHKMQFYKLNKDKPNEPELTLCSIPKIQYGAAFNAAHKAINRTHQCMRKIHEIGGEYIKRIHTDSFAVTPDLPYAAERRIFQFLSDNDYHFSVKGVGSSHFLDLNSGLIGNKVIGSREQVITELRENQIKVPKVMISPDEFERWKKRVSEEFLLTQSNPLKKAAMPADPVEQMSLL